VVKDVYAEDEAESTGHDPVYSCTFLVLADPDPLVLCKVSSQIALTNFQPTRCSLLVQSDGLVRIEIDVAVLSTHQADLIVRKLLQLTFVVEATARISESACAMAGG
jgi:hypothetical protein